MLGNENLKETIVSYAGGILFGIAWWLLADAAIISKHNDDPQQVEFIFLLPAFFGTFAIWLLNAFPWQALSMGGLDEVSHSRAKCALFFSLMVGFGSIFGAAWILIEVYTGEESKADSSYAGAMILLNAVLIFLAGVVMRLGRTESF